MLEKVFIFRQFAFRFNWIWTRTHTMLVQKLFKRRERHCRHRWKRMNRVVVFFFFWILSAIHLTLHPLECMQGILIFFFWFRQIAMHLDSHDLPRCQIKQQIMKNKTFLTAFHLKSCQYYNVYVPCMLLFEISLLFVSF